MGIVYVEWEFDKNVLMAKVTFLETVFLVSGDISMAVVMPTFPL